MIKPSKKYGFSRGRVGQVLVLALLASTGMAFAKVKKETTKTPPPVKAENPAAAEKKPESITNIKEIQKNLGTHTNFSLDFRQEVYRDLRKKTAITSGTAYFSKPKRFRWILTAPQKSEWIYDGSDLYFDDLEKKQGTRYKADTAQGKELRQVVDLIVDFSGIEEHYTISDYKKKDTIVSFDLSPRQKTNFEKLEVEVDVASYYLKRLKLFFEGKNTSTFVFSNFQSYKASPVTFAPYSAIKVSDSAK